MLLSHRLPTTTKPHWSFISSLPTGKTQQSKLRLFLLWIIFNTIFQKYFNYSMCSVSLWIAIILVLPCSTLVSVVFHFQHLTTASLFFFLFCSSYVSFVYLTQIEPYCKAQNSDALFLFVIVFCFCLRVCVCNIVDNVNCWCWGTTTICCRWIHNDKFDGDDDADDFDDDVIWS